MKKYKVVMFSVLMSMLLFLPATLQAKRGAGDRDIKGEGKTGERYQGWLSSLNLDEDVLRQMKEMKLKNKEKVLDLKNRIEKKELEMEKLLLEKKLDFKKILTAHDEISALRQKISRNMIEQKIEMYNLVPDDKKEEAKKIFLRRLLRSDHGKSGMYEKRDKSGRPMKK